MAIQNRRGAYGDFDPSKLLPGEWAVVLSGDTNASDGLACYMCFKAGVVKRMATYEDMIDNIAATSGELIAEEVDRQCKEAIQECKAATNSANIAITNANSAAANAVSVAASAQAAADRANEAAGNIEQANIKPLAYSVSGESITASNSAEKPLIGLTVHGRADQVSTTGAQLFNKSTVTPESYVRDTDGTVVASTTRPTCASDYITLDGAESIYIISTMTSNRWGAFYNDKKEYVSGIAGYSSPITVPVGAVYIRLTVADDNLDTFMVNTGSTALPYEPYTYGVPSPSVEYPQAIDIAGNGGSINVKMTGKNLFDADSWEILDKQSDGSYKTNQATTQKNLQIDIPVGVYTLSYDCKSDADSNARLRVVYEDGTTGATVLPSNGTYVHFKYVTENKKISSIGTDFSRYGSGIELKRIQLEYGSIETSYEPYKSTQSVNLSTSNGLAGLKVSSGGNYTDASGQQWICDEIVRNERGTGKRIQRIGIIESYASETINTAYMSTTGQLTEGATVIYVLDDAIETDLTAEEIAALSALHTYSPTTTISNDAGCDMTAAYVTQYYQGVGDAMFYGVADNLTTEASGTSVLDAHQGKVLKGMIDDIWKTIYPVGSIYMSVNNTDPGTLFGGTWEAWGTGRVPVGVDSGDSDFSTSEKIGGEKTNTHNHYTLSGNDDNMLYVGSTQHAVRSRVSILKRCAISFTSYGEGPCREDSTYDESINILQPYITCYMWKRTA